MQTQQPPRRFLKISAFALLGITALSALVLQLNAADQPKPGPEHKKLEVWVGEWTYEGTGEVTPLTPSAGKFKGKLSGRVVLDGFFVMGQAEDVADDGYIFRNIWIIGYDPEKKAYLGRSFQNDGTFNSDTFEVTGNTWTTTGTRTAPDGKLYKTRMVQTFSPDGKSHTEVYEYSADDGRTWATAYKASMIRVSQSR
jgi:hypothetical protein